MPEENNGNDLPVSSTPLFAANEKITKINVADEIKNSFLDYSMSVIISRALPDARDGLKPSQRRILYAMHDLSLFPNRQHRKCAKICGDTSGNYHPHGEAVIYPTLVHMAQPWAMRERLVDEHSAAQSQGSRGWHLRANRRPGYHARRADETRKGTGFSDRLRDLRRERC